MITYEASSTTITFKGSRFIGTSTAITRLIMITFVNIYLTIISLITCAIAVTSKSTNLIIAIAVILARFVSLAFIDINFTIISSVASVITGAKISSRSVMAKPIILARVVN